MLVLAFLDGEGPSDLIANGSGDDAAGRRVGVGVVIGTACAVGVGVDRRSWWSSICSKYSVAEGAGDGAEEGGTGSVDADLGGVGRKA